MNSSTETDLASKYDMDLLKKLFAAQALSNIRKSADDREYT